MPGFDDMPNVGPYLNEKLMDAGVQTPDQLIRLGSREAFLMLKIRDGGVCLHVLYALEGAVQGVRKNLLSDAVKTELKHFFHSIK